MHVCLRVCMRVSVGAPGGQNRASGLLDLELHVVVSGLLWVLGIKSGSSVTIVHVLIHTSISLVPRNLTLDQCVQQKYVIHIIQF